MRELTPKQVIDALQNGTVADTEPLALKGNIRLSRHDDGYLEFRGCGMTSWASIPARMIDRAIIHESSNEADFLDVEIVLKRSDSKESAVYAAILQQASMSNEGVENSNKGERCLTYPAEEEFKCRLGGLGGWEPSDGFGETRTEAIEMMRAYPKWRFPYARLRNFTVVLLTLMRSHLWKGVPV